MSYAEVQNPDLSGFDTIDHCDFTWDAYQSKVDAVKISNSSFHKFRGGDPYRRPMRSIRVYSMPDGFPLVRIQRGS